MLGVYFMVGIPQGRDVLLYVPGYGGPSNSELAGLLELCIRKNVTVFLWTGMQFEAVLDLWQSGAIYFAEDDKYRTNPKIELHYIKIIPQYIGQGNTRRRVDYQVPETQVAYAAKAAQIITAAKDNILLNKPNTVTIQGHSAGATLLSVAMVTEFHVVQEIARSVDVCNFILQSGAISVSSANLKDFEASLEEISSKISVLITYDPSDKVLPEVNNREVLQTLGSRYGNIQRITLPMHPYNNHAQAIHPEGTTLVIGFDWVAQNINQR